MPVFVMRIDQEDAKVGPLRHDFAEDHRHAGGLANAGRTKHGKVLRQKIVDIGVGAKADILMELADVHDIGTAEAEHHLELALGD